MQAQLRTAPELEQSAAQEQLWAAASKHPLSNGCHGGVDLQPAKHAKAQATVYSIREKYAVQCPFHTSRFELYTIVI